MIGALATLGVASVLPADTASAADDKEPAIVIDGSGTPAGMNSVQVQTLRVVGDTLQWEPTCVTNLPHDGSATDTGLKAVQDRAIFTAHGSPDCTGEVLLREDGFPYVDIKRVPSSVTTPEWLVSLNTLDSDAGTP